MLSLVAFVLACSDQDYEPAAVDPDTTPALADTGDVPPDDGGDGSGDDGRGDGGGDGGGGPSACEMEFDALGGTWDYRSELPLSDASAFYINWVADSAQDLCVIGPVTGTPSWFVDLFCTVADLGHYFEDMEVQHSLTFTPAGEDKTWDVSEVWSVVTFDPHGNALTMPAEDLTCGVEVEPWTATYDCNQQMTFSEHSYDVPMGGFVQTALDLLSCEQMGHTPGCSWDTALDTACDDIEDWWVEMGCVALVENLTIPEPCVDTTEISLSPVTSDVIIQGQDASIVGAWEGELLGEAFSGSFVGHQVK